VLTLEIVENVLIEEIASWGGQYPNI